MKKQVLVGLGALVIAAGASAQGYGVVSAGVSRLSVDCAGIPSCDKTGTAFKVLGGYKFNPNFAAELGYFDFGKAKASDPTASLSIKTTAVGGGVAWHQDIAPNWNFVGRIGLAQVKTKIDATLVGLGSGSDSDKNTTAYFGLGVGYKMSQNVSLDLAWDASRSKFNKLGLDESGNVNAYSVGMTFSF